MINTNKFLILSVVIILLGWLFGLFDDYRNLTNLGVFLAWFALYQIIRNMEVDNENMDKIEERFTKIEKRLD